jgi:hypothetical protein
VTLALPGRRPSRVPSLMNVLARRRLLTHALECVHYASSLEQGVPPAKGDPMALDGVGIRRGTDECAVPPLGIGVQVIQL